MPKKSTTYRLLCEMASFRKFDKGVTILLLDPVSFAFLLTPWYPVHKMDI